MLDFFCPAAKLVIEVDGAIHDSQREQDAARTEHLEQYGYRALRFTNEHVLANLDTVLDAILLAAQDLPAERRVRRKKRDSTATTDPATP